MRSRLVITGLFFIQVCLATLTFSQSINTRYNFKHLNVQTGLAQNIVYHFLNDSRGYMWLGTRNGVSVYDGIRTVNFRQDPENKNSISSNFITRILEDSNQNVWVGTGNGIDLYNRSDNNFSHYSLNLKNGKDDEVFCVLLGFSSRNELWFIETKTKAIRVFNTDTHQSRVLASTDAVDGSLYIDSASQEVHIWTYLSVGSYEYIFKSGSLLSAKLYFAGKNYPSLEIFHAFQQKDSVAWLSSTEGLIQLNPISGKFILYNKSGTSSVMQTRYSVVAPSGLLWVSTGGQGVYAFDPKEKKFLENFRNSELDQFSICSNNIVSIYFDKVGNIWCGSYGNGASFANVESNFFSKFLPQAEVSSWNEHNNIVSLSADTKGNIWAISMNSQSIWLLDSSFALKENRFPRLPDGKNFLGSMYQMFFYSGNFGWCLTDRGLFRYNITENSFRKYEYVKLSTQLFGSDWCKFMIRMHDSSLVFTTFAGLYRITKTRSDYSIEPFSDLNKMPFTSFDLLFEDRDHYLYVKDMSDNLYVLSQSPDSGYKVFKRYKVPADVSQFWEDAAQNQIYLATDNGLLVLRKANWELQSCSINKQLPFSSIASVFIFKNKLWLFGDKGLYSSDLNNSRGRTYTIEDGLPANEFNQSAVIFTPSNKCLAGTTNGLVYFDPGKLQDSVYAPRAQLVNFYINDTMAHALHNPQELSSINLSYQENTFSFDFSPITFQHSGECSYEYKLDPYDENWIRSGSIPFTRYSKIPPGKYNFRLRVIDANGVASAFEKHIDIFIAKAFWQTNWFKACALLAVAFVCWLMVRSYFAAKIRKQQREFEKQQAIEKERTRIATDMHDELGAGLSRIKFLSETIGMKKQMQQSLGEELGSIAKYSNEMISKMGEIVWALNEKNDSLSDLLSYTRSYAAEYLSQNGIHCNITSPENFPGTFVSGEFRRNVYLTVKEALHNIVKHAQANTVNISMNVNHRLEIFIQDNGVGFKKSNTRAFSNGLNNMERRMKEIGGSFAILIENGTEIILSVPIPA